MKQTFPLMAALAATLLAVPATAQDINSILNPGNFAARLNMGDSPALVRLPRDMSDLFEGRIHGAVIADQIAALDPATRSLAPLRSIAPVPRGTTARLAPVGDAPTVTTLAPATDGAGLAEMMADAADAAPDGANTLVINGDTTAVIEASPAAEPPRRSLWQRLFGG
ncbi:hypothetical protein [Gymnodinialimonas ceratoperidinii]|uniref:Uncharacterized protein n=1 Tax=Gymnodinialimonas ceratoperidinii TaxID=2856823 RepID=A0A8F6TUX2_9RHOB|nr:hypothetical protein [Gymnodinialimonas ceratoperidinii]QXT38908.1 hypothetical protein KYE46_13325 [Gymnodinialimonas ceratoperidinii]